MQGELEYFAKKDTVVSIKVLLQPGMTIGAWTWTLVTTMSLLVVAQTTTHSIGLIEATCTTAAWCEHVQSSITVVGPWCHDMFGTMQTFSQWFPLLQPFSQRHQCCSYCLPTVSRGTPLHPADFICCHNIILDEFGRRLMQVLFDMFQNLTLKLIIQLHALMFFLPESSARDRQELKFHRVRSHVAMTKVGSWQSAVASVCKILEATSKRRDVGTQLAALQNGSEWHMKKGNKWAWWVHVPWKVFS